MAVPDLDGDGVLDVISVSRYDGRDSLVSAPGEPDEPRGIFVDALSGKDGRPLWRWYTDVNPGELTRAWVPAWWGRAADGWPFLAVRLGGDEPDQSETYGRLDYIAKPVLHFSRLRPEKSGTPCLASSEQGSRI